MQGMRDEVDARDRQLRVWLGPTVASRNPLGHGTESCGQSLPLQALEPANQKLVAPSLPDDGEETELIPIPPG